MARFPSLPGALLSRVLRLSPSCFKITKGESGAEQMGDCIWLRRTAINGGFNLSILVSKEKTLTPGSLNRCSRTITVHCGLVHEAADFAGIRQMAGSNTLLTHVAYR